MDENLVGIKRMSQEEKINFPEIEHCISIVRENQDIRKTDGKKIVQRNPLGEMDGCRYEVT